MSGHPFPERQGLDADGDLEAICVFCEHRYRWHEKTCTHDSVQLRGNCGCPGFKPSAFRSVTLAARLPAAVSPDELCAACEHRYTFHDVELAITEYGGKRSLFEGRPMSCYYDDLSLMSSCECNGWSRSGRVRTASRSSGKESST
ncbi:MAG: hypothetical protein M3O99_01860 [Chloroflexota bacterium]|nr:hypothetical protein [Chloroflexota bacterium]